MVVLCGALAQAGLSADPKPAPVDPDHAAKMARGLDVFKKQVRTILADRCLKCHGGKRTEGEFELVDRAGMLKGGSAGPAIIPGRGKDSLLIKLVNHQKEPKMPHKTAKMPEAEIAALTNWIDLGAPYDTPLVGGAVKGPSWTEKVVNGVRGSSGPSNRSKVEPPPVKDGRGKTLADRSSREAGSRQPEAEPSRDSRTLIRRAQFDLTGLPAFARKTWQSRRQHARSTSRMIDGLLASPLWRALGPTLVRPASPKATASSTTTTAPPPTTIATLSSRRSTRTCCPISFVKWQLRVMSLCRRTTRR